MKPYGSAVPSGKSRSGPTNTSGGVVQLPAITEPIFKRQQACAMNGPIFPYDGSNPSARQFPPQVNRNWMISGCDPAFGFHLMTLDESGEKILEDKKIFGTVGVDTLVDLKQGPDGALYFVGYLSGVGRIDYTGSCKDPDLLPEKALVTTVERKGAQAPRMNNLVRLESGSPRIPPRFRRGGH